MGSLGWLSLLLFLRPAYSAFLTFSLSSREAFPLDEVFLRRLLLDLLFLDLPLPRRSCSSFDGFFCLPLGPLSHLRFYLLPQEVLFHTLLPPSVLD